MSGYIKKMGLMVGVSTMALGMFAFAPANAFDDVDWTWTATVTEIVTKEVSQGGAVTLPGLGKFACRSRPERTVRNPSTGEQMLKPADRVAKVTIAKQLKDVINA